MKSVSSSARQQRRLLMTIWPDSTVPLGGDASGAMRYRSGATEGAQ